MQVRCEKTGVRVSLGGARVVGSGGEASVYAADELPDCVLKIYHRHSASSRGDGSVARKLELMTANPPDDPMAGRGHKSIAWPIERVLNQSGRVVGYSMPRVTGRPVFDIYNRARRRQLGLVCDLRIALAIARNLAVAVEAVHERRYVIGDLNQGNVLVNDRGLITLIDTDSFQVRDAKSGAIFRCPVGTPEYTPPELRDRDFARTTRTEQHDAFGLAILIFQLLMDGVHPYQGQCRGFGDLPLEERIQRGLFAYAAKPKPGVSPMPAAVSSRALGDELNELFGRAFGGGGPRPAASSWAEALASAAAGLQCCRRDERHLFPSDLGACPWCERDSRTSLRPPPAAPMARTAPTARTVGRQKPRRRRRGTMAALIVAVVAAVFVFGVIAGGRGSGSGRRPVNVGAGSAWSGLTEARDGSLAGREGAGASAARTREPNTERRGTVSARSVPGGVLPPGATPQDHGVSWAETVRPRAAAAKKVVDSTTPPNVTPEYPTGTRRSDADDRASQRGGGQSKASLPPMADGGNGTPAAADQATTPAVAAGVRAFTTDRGTVVIVNEPTEAADLYRRAVAARDGVGRLRDYVEAYSLFERAERRGHSSARDAREELSRRMTAAQVLEAKGLSAKQGQ